MYIESLSFRVAGVTFNNDDGSSRQRNIEKLHPGDSLFLVPFKFDGKQAFHICDIDNRCIGNLPEVYVNDISNHLSNGHHIALCVDEKLGYDEYGHRLDGYNLGVQVALDVHDDRPEENRSASTIKPSDTPEPVKKKSGRVMIGFGIFFLIGTVASMNPFFLIPSALLLYFGMKRHKEFKDSKK